jgi:outer membrane receptor for ferrienterochelin and colicins
MSKIIYIIFNLIFVSSVSSQTDSTATDSSKYITDPIIVTGTKTESKLSSTTLPVSVINSSEIFKQSGVKLTDVLSEQPGLQITYFLGAGVQMQGLDGDYTLILIDGEPVTGRQGGAIDLSRFSVGNIKQIEIVKGPSSSLYGSDALAGVINIITKDANDKLRLTLNTKYGSFGNMEVNTSVDLKKNKLGFYVFADRTSSSGYDLTSDSPSKTAPKYSSYTFTPKLTYKLSNSTNLIFDTRFYAEMQDNVFTIDNSQNQPVLFNDKFTIYDWNITGKVNHLIGSKFDITGTLYTSNYYNNETSTYDSDGRTFEDRTFQQSYNKAEGQFRSHAIKNNIQTVGAGYIYEQVKADYIKDGKRSANLYFAYAQNEWNILKNLSLVAGARFDSHSDYDKRLSPKISALYKPISWLSVRGSAGSGFKAPNFQQLYLDFTNPQVGYSVFGTANFKEGFQKLQETGQIAEILINPSTVVNIEPEISYAINGGLELSPFKWMNAKANFFRNDIDNLIDVVQVAKKTNGQSVFTYFNLNKIYTQGIETELMIKPAGFLYFSAGYQYLKAVDKDALDNVRAGKILKVGATGIIRPVQEVEYGGLFGRPKHSGVFKLVYDNQKLGFTANLRTIIKDKYGYADYNSNGILDDKKEYAPGYALWNITFTQKIKAFLTVQAGVENMFDRMDIDRSPELPGRIFYGAIQLTY